MHSQTTGNKPIKTLLLFSLPILFALFIQQGYYLVNYAIIGNFLGESAVATVGSLNSISFLLLGIIQGIATGFSLVVAQRLGKKDKEGIKNSLGTSYLLSFILSIFFTVLGVLLTNSILSLQNIQSEIYVESKKYLIVLFLSFGFQLFHYLLTGIIRSLGNSKFPFYTILAATFINIILDYIVIGVFKQSVYMSVVNLAISNTLVSIFCYLYIKFKFSDLKLNKTHFILNKTEVWQHFKMGIPTTMQFILASIGVIALQNQVNLLGTSVIAAWSIANKIETLAYQPANAICVAASIFFAYNISSNSKALKDGYFASLILAIATVIFAILFSLFLGETIVKLVVKDPSQALITDSSLYLKMYRITLFPLVLLGLGRSALQGLGKHFFPLTASILETIIRVSFAIFIIPTSGYLGLVISQGTSWVMGGIYIFIGFSIYIFRKMNVLKNLEALEEQLI